MCAICENKKKIEHEFLEITVEGSKLVVDYSAYSCDSDFYEKIDIKFCPECGKRLTA